MSDLHDPLCLVSSCFLARSQFDKGQGGRGGRARLAERECLVITISYKGDPSNRQSERRDVLQLGEGNVASWSKASSHVALPIVRKNNCSYSGKSTKEGRSYITWHGQSCRNTLVVWVEVFLDVTGPPEATGHHNHAIFSCRVAPSPSTVFQPIVCLSVFLSVSVCLCLSLSVSVCLSLRVSLSMCLSVCLFVCLSVSLCLSVCPSVRPSVRRSVWLSVCLSGCVAVWLCVCVSGHPRQSCELSASRAGVFRRTKQLAAAAASHPRFNKYQVDMVYLRRCITVLP